MSTHNICFNREIWKIISKLSSKYQYPPYPYFWPFETSLRLWQYLIVSHWLKLMIISIILAAAGQQALSHFTNDWDKYDNCAPASTKWNYLSVKSTCRGVGGDGPCSGVVRGADFCLLGLSPLYLFRFESHLDNMCESHNLHVMVSQVVSSEIFSLCPWVK